MDWENRSEESTRMTPGFVYQPICCFFRRQQPQKQYCWSPCNKWSRSTTRTRYKFWMATPSKKGQENKSEQQQQVTIQTETALPNQHWMWLKRKFNSPFALAGFLIIAIVSLTMGSKKQKRRITGLEEERVKPQSFIDSLKKEQATTTTTTTSSNNNNSSTQTTTTTRGDSGFRAYPGKAVTSDEALDLLEDNRKKFIIVGGKGGVGKTSMSSALATK
jgi:translation initiation factor 1 (eIF-1/SUI1)